MRLRIVSNGHARSTRVTVLDSGEDITGLVKAITWHCDVDERGGAAWAEITMLATELDLTGDAELPTEIDFRTGRPKAPDA